MHHDDACCFASATLPTLHLTAYSVVLATSQCCRFSIGNKQGQQGICDAPKSEKENKLMIIGSKKCRRKTFENTAGYSGNLPKIEKKLSTFAPCAMRDEQALNNLKRREWDCLGAATNANPSRKSLLQYKSQYCCTITTVMAAHAVNSA